MPSGFQSLIFSIPLIRDSGVRSRPAFQAFHEVHHRYRAEKGQILFPLDFRVILLDDLHGSIRSSIRARNAGVAGERDIRPFPDFARQVVHDRITECKSGQRLGPETGLRDFFQYECAVFWGRIDQKGIRSGPLFERMSAQRGPETSYGTAPASSALPLTASRPFFTPDNAIFP